MSGVRIVGLVLLLGACESAPRGPEPVLVERYTGAEAFSLLGDSLAEPALSDSVRAQYERLLAEAVAAHDSNPGDPETIIWLGRRTAYLGRFREAVDIFSEGIRRHPDDARMYRHRGHRYITLRRFDNAIDDLFRAAQLVAGRQDEVEPDGLPNARNIPTSTLQFNIWYHLGLAHYLNGDFERALSAYEQALHVSRNPDSQVAARHWLYMSLRRLVRNNEAREILEDVTRDMDVIENGGYHRLLLMYKGVLRADSLTAPASGDRPGVEDATVAYGLGNWHLYNGREKEAREIFSRIVQGAAWPAFGHIAAEAELARMGK